MPSPSPDTPFGYRPGGEDGDSQQRGMLSHRRNLVPPAVHGYTLVGTKLLDVSVPMSLSDPPGELALPPMGTLAKPDHSRASLRRTAYESPRTRCRRAFPEGRDRQRRGFIRLRDSRRMASTLILRGRLDRTPTPTACFRRCRRVNSIRRRNRIELVIVAARASDRQAEKGLAEDVDSAVHLLGANFAQVGRSIALLRPIRTSPVRTGVSSCFPSESGVSRRQSPQFAPSRN